MATVFDTHCHLSPLNPSPDYFCLNVTTQPSEWSSAIERYQHHPLSLPAIGLHPWFVHNDSVQHLSSMTALIKKYDVFALGEIGLDFSARFQANKKLQIDLFEKQLEIAKYHQLPVSLHCVKAHNVMLDLLKKHDLGKTGVLHGLGGSLPLIQQYIDLGYRIGINAVTCRSNARRYHQMVQSFSLTHFVLETDFPNVVLPGHAHAALSDIFNVAECVANLLDSTTDAVIEQTAYNAQQIFLR